jgi:hypothetical protein
MDEKPEKPDLFQQPATRRLLGIGAALYGLGLILRWIGYL